MIIERKIDISLKCWSCLVNIKNLIGNFIDIGNVYSYLDFPGQSKHLNLLRTELLVRCIKTTHRFHRSFQPY